MRQITLPDLNDPDDLAQVLLGLGELEDLDTVRVRFPEGPGRQVLDLTSFWDVLPDGPRPQVRIEVSCDVQQALGIVLVRGDRDFCIDHVAGCEVPGVEVHALQAGGRVSRFTLGSRPVNAA